MAAAGIKMAPTRPGGVTRVPHPGESAADATQPSGFGAMAPSVLPEEHQVPIPETLKKKKKTRLASSRPTRFPLVPHVGLGSRAGASQTIKKRLDIVGQGDGQIIPPAFNVPGTASVMSAVPTLTAKAPFSRSGPTGQGGTDQAPPAETPPQTA